MATFKEVSDKLEPLVKRMSNFKIGKTGQDLKDRYDQLHSDKYKNISQVGSSQDAETIDEFEKYLIDLFKDYKNCDNEKVGGGDMEKSDKYMVYIVYN